MARANIEELLAREFKEGSIIRVRMKNFLTYDECEVFPGPKLNVVIGPNGTGKSAMTHAICLACAGSTGDVGRSNDLSKYVKHGKEGEESFAEIDILGKDKLHTIRREINSGNRGSKWFLNNRSAKLADIKEIIAGLNIDIDNLCSFMPQDKVGKFTQYSAKEILQNTLKSVTNRTSSGRSLYEEQVELSDQEQAKETARRERDSKQVIYDRLAKEIQQMDVEMHRIKERETNQEHLNLYKIKKLQLVGDELLNEKEARQNEVNEAEAQVKVEKKRIAPLEEKLRDLKRQLGSRESAASAVTQRHRVLQGDLDEAMEAVRKCDVDLHTCKMEYNAINKDRENERRKREKYIQERQTEQVKLDACLKILPQVMERMEEKNRELEAINEAQQVAQEKVLLCKREIQQLRAQLNSQENSLRNLQDFKQAYREKLRASNDTYQRAAFTAMEFLANNEASMREKGLLHGQVFGPVAAYCQVDDPACAAMIEKYIPRNKLFGFVVMNDNDEKVLRHELRVRLKLPIDIYTMKNPAINQARSYSPQLMEEFKRDFQVEGYLSDQITCPDEIRSLFYTFQGFQNVIWGRCQGNFKLDESQLNRLCPQNVGQFTFYMHEAGQRGMEITEYNGKRSRKAAHLPPSTSSIGIKGMNILSGGGSNDEDVARQRELLAAQIQETQQKITDLDNQGKAAYASQQELIQQHTTVRNEKKDMVTAQKTPVTSRAKIQRLTNLIEMSDKKLSVDENRNREKSQNKYKGIFQNMLRMLKEATDKSQKCSEHAVDKVILTNLKTFLQTATKEAEMDMQEAKNALIALNRIVHECQQSRASIEARIKLNDEQLDELAASYGGDDIFINQVFPRVGEKCPEETLEAVEDRMIQLQAAIDASMDNPRLKERYAEAQKEYAKLHSELENATAVYKDAEVSLRQRAEEWRVGTRDIAQQINMLFKKYMKELRFDGEVLLRETGRFIDYEMQMRVSFRHNSQLADLSGTRHSGGERAVSTIMYLMALQDMTSAPFRVVDEINQGMDERNERLVFDRIVSSCCGHKDKPQYFLVTPKLLPGLRALEHDDVTILTVFNGPGIKTKWKFDTILRAAIRHKKGLAPEEESEQVGGKRGAKETPLQDKKRIKAGK